MNLYEQNGYLLYQPTSGGKAGKGHNITSSIQVRKDNLLIKNIRYSTLDPKARKVAIDKALNYIDSISFHHA